MNAWGKLRKKNSGRTRGLWHTERESYPLMMTYSYMGMWTRFPLP